MGVRILLTTICDLLYITKDISDLGHLKESLNHYENFMTILT